MKDVEIHQKVIELRAEGKSLRSVAKQLGIDKDTVAKIAKEHQEEIKQCTKKILEDLLENTACSRVLRLRYVAGFVKKVNAELKKRPLDFCSTENLVKMLVSCHKELRSDYDSALDSLIKQENPSKSENDTNSSEKNCENVEGG